jgi:hypothetical protein
MTRASSNLIKLRIVGYERVFLLSQYIGDFHPDAHVKGLAGWSLMALTFRSFSATILSSVFIDAIIIIINKFRRTKVTIWNGKSQECTI